MKKILIFGATGNIGVYFTDYCIQQNNQDYEFIAVGRKKTNFFEKHGINYVQVDLTKEEDFLKLPSENVYAIVNLAGAMPAYLKNNDPFIYANTNIIGGIRVLEYARRVHCDRVIYTQSWSELGGYWGKVEKLSPDMPVNMVYKGDHAFYVISKNFVVNAMEYYKQEYGIKNFVFRLPNIYLYNPQKKYFVDGEEKFISYRKMIDTVSSGHDIEMWGDPKAFKDIIYVKDLCQMMYLALFANVNGGTYNAGTGIKTTLKEQIEGIVKVFAPYNSEVNIISKPEKNTFTSFVMDISNIKNDLGYEPKYDYIQYLRDYKEEEKLKRFDELFI